MLQVGKALADATGSTELLTCAQEHINSGKIPKAVIDHWFHGSRPNGFTLNTGFLCHMQKLTSDTLQGDNHFLSVENLPTDISEDDDDFNTILTSGKSDWNMGYHEAGNHKTANAYFPKQKMEIPITLHALFVNMGFDHRMHQQEQKFALWPSTQPAANNRDFEMLYAKKNPEMSNLFSMFEYATSKPGSLTTDDDNDRLGFSDACVLLSQRVRRDQVNDKAIAKILAPNTHMHKISSTRENPVTREKGIKILGDHVPIACPYSEMCKLFKICTVSSDLINVILSCKCSKLYHC